MTEAALPDTPYKGLRPYSEEDALFFFGREVERDRISANLRASRLTLLYGTSGVGKSSVLTAGVAAHLHQVAQRNLAKRNKPGFAVVVFNSWRDDPLAGLANCIEESVAQALKGKTFEPVPPSRTLAQTLQTWTERVGGDLLIILDQFEEYFLYHAQEDGEGTFAIEFPRVIDHPDLRVNFLVSIREDALAKLDRFKGRIPNLFGNYLRIEHLDREAAQDAIEKPLAQYNSLLAADGQQVSIEPALVEAVLDQVKTGEVILGEAGRGVVGGSSSPPPTEARIETPYLQLVMTRLWDEEVRVGSRTLRLETLNRLEGAKHIVQTHLDTVMNTLTPSERDTAARVFRYLVTPSGTKIAYPVLELAGDAGLEETQLASVLEKLSRGDVRILRQVGPALGQPAEPRYEHFEIFHDVLAPAILDWRAQYVQAQERAEAERRTQEQRRQALAAQAELMRNQRADLLPCSVLLAVEAMRLSPSLEADQTLRRGLALLPRPLARLEHNGSVQAVALSPDGRFLTTASQDHTVRIWDVQNRRQVAQLEHESVVIAVNIDTSVVFSPDGRFLATASGDHTARIWEVPSGREVVLLPHPKLVRTVIFSPDGRFLATASGDHTARVWEVSSRREVAPMTHDDLVWAVAFSPDGRFLATASQDHTARVWEVSSGREVVRIPHEREVRAVTFSPDGQLLATASYSIARMWEAMSGREVARMIHKDLVWAIAFSPDGTYLATASQDHTARVWEVSSGREVVRMPHEHEVRAVTFSPDGQLLATASYGIARVWEAISGREVARMIHKDFVWAVAFSPDGAYLVSASSDHTARVWESSGYREVARMTHAEKVNAVAFSPDGTHLATASADPLFSQDNTVQLWQIVTGRGIGRMQHKGGVFAVIFSPDGRFVATASGDHTARVWEAASGREVARMTHDDLVWAVAFSPDGTYLATASMDGTARVWEVTGGREVARLSHGRNVVAIAFSSDGRHVATASGDHTARVWEAASGREVARMTHDDLVWAVTFSPDGTYLATASMDGTARVWEVTSGRKVTSLPHEKSVKAVVFSPDGHYLATASADHTARIWEMITGREVSRLTHEGTVWTVVFSPDGRYLATASADRTTRVWLWRPEDLIAEACARLTRNLKPEEWRQYLGDEPYHKTCPDLP